MRDESIPSSSVPYEENANMSRKLFRAGLIAALPMAIAVLILHPTGAKSEEASAPSHGSETG
jgi:hypothetical protein